MPAVTDEIDFTELPDKEMPEGINFSDLPDSENIDWSGLPDASDTAISTAPEPSIYERAKEFFLPIDVEKERARAQNALLINQTFPSIPINTAFENQDSIFEVLKKQDATLEDYNRYAIPKLDWYDKVKDTIVDNPAQLVPFVASGSEAIRLVRIMNAVNRLPENNGITEQEKNDLTLLREFVDQSNRDTTFGYKVISVLSALPAFVGELALTYGVYTGVSRASTYAAKEGITKLLGKVGREALEKKLVQSGIGLTAGAIGRTAQATVAGITRIRASAIKNMIDEFELTGAEAGEVQGIITGEGDDLGMAYLKAFGEQQVEVWSEYAGAPAMNLLKTAAKPVKNVMLKSSFLKAFLKANPNATISDFNKIIQKTGWSGPLGEMLEERVADIGHGLLYEVGLGNQEFQWPSLEQIGVELVAFSAPTLAGKAFIETKKAVKGMKPAMPIAEEGAPIEAEGIKAAPTPEAAPEAAPEKVSPEQEVTEFQAKIESGQEFTEEDLAAFADKALAGEEVTEEVGPSSPEAEPSPPPPPPKIISRSIIEGGKIDEGVGYRGVPPGGYHTTIENYGAEKAGATRWETIDRSKKPLIWESEEAQAIRDKVGYKTDYLAEGEVAPPELNQKLNEEISKAGYDSIIVKGGEEIGLLNLPDNYFSTKQTYNKVRQNLSSGQHQVVIGNQAGKDIARVTFDEKGQIVNEVAPEFITQDLQDYVKGKFNIDLIAPSAEFQLEPTRMPIAKPKPPAQEDSLRNIPSAMPSTAIETKDIGDPMLEEITQREEAKRQTEIPIKPIIVKPAKASSKANPATDSLATYIRKSGGFNYQKEHMKGELDRLSSKEAGTSGLLNKKGGGLTLDQMLEAAIEDDYFNENADINDLLNATENEIYMKKKHYSAQKVWTDKELGKMMAEGMVLESKKDYGKILTENHKEYKDDSKNLAIAEKALKSTRQLELYGLPETQRDLLDKRGGEPVEKGGIKTHAIGITPELIRKGYINLQGQEVKTPKQVALLAQVFRNPQYETFRIIYVKDNKVVGHEGITSNLPGAISVFKAGAVLKEIHRFKDRFKRLGADGAWLVHNHPSGQAIPSPQDLNITARFSTILPIKGHIVIDSGEYAFIPADGSEGRVHDLKTDDAMLKPSLSHELVGASANNQEKIAEIAAKIKTGEYITALYMSSNLKVRGIQEMPYGMLKNPKTLTDYLRGRAREFGAQFVALAGKDLKGADHFKMDELVTNAHILDYVALFGSGIQYSYRDTVSVRPAGGWMGSVVKKYNVAEEKGEYGKQEAFFPETKAPADFRRASFIEAARAAVEAHKLGNKEEYKRATARMLAIAKGEIKTKTELEARERFEELDKGEIDIKEHLKYRKKGDVAASIKSEVDRSLGIISTRLKNINPNIKSAVRRYTYKLEKLTALDNQVSYDFLEGYSKLDDNTKVELSHALLDGNKEKADKIASKYGLLDAINKVREMLPQERQRAIEAGFKVGEIENYWPRIVKDPEGLLAELRKTKEWTAIDEAIRKIEKKADEPLSDNDKAAIADMLLRGFPKDKITIKLPETSPFKQRKLEKIPRQLLKYYMPADQSLITHIRRMNNAIEAANFFGKKKAEGKEAVITQLDLLSDVSADNLIGKSIGDYIIDLKEKGLLTREKEKNLRDILQAVFMPAETSYGVRVYKNLTYLQLLTQIMPSITQIMDIALTAERAGYWKALKAAGKAVIWKSEITTDDIHLERILEEFEGGRDKIARALQKGLKYSAFSAMDRIGKESLLNAKLEQFRDWAKEGDERLNNRIKEVFGKDENVDAIIREIKEKKKTDNILFMLWNELSEVQPISKIEVPERYLTLNYGKTFYALKTYQLKLLDIYRNDIWHEIKNGDKLEGFKKLARLTIALILLGVGTDKIKDFILGKKTEFVDLAWDNLLRLGGFSKYTLYKARREGLSKALLAQFAPPAGAIDAITKDIDELMRKGKFEKGARTPQHIPMVGKLYYWWFGRGSVLEKEKPKRK